VHRDEPIAYQELADAFGASVGSWRAFVSNALVPRWMAAYDAATPWPSATMSIDQGELTYLFDAAPSLHRAGGRDTADRVVAVWGYSSRPRGERDRARMAGFIPAGRGGLAAATTADIWFRTPPAVGSISTRFRRLRRSTAAALAKADGGATSSATRPDIRQPPCSCAPTYDGPGWAPAWLEHGLLAEQRLRVERISNGG
jgi:hypothetical protein